MKRRHAKILSEMDPPKFAAGDRVKPTAEAIRHGWTKPGRVVICNLYIVDVLMDGEADSHNYSIDFWEPE